MHYPSPLLAVVSPSQISGPQDPLACALSYGGHYMQPSSLSFRTFLPVQLKDSLSIQALESSSGSYPFSHVTQLPVHETICLVVHLSDLHTVPLS